MEAWLEWAQGPAFRFALALMLLGVIRHVFLLFLGMRSAMRRAGDKVLPWKFIRKWTFAWMFPVKHLGHTTFLTVTSIVFHVGVILAPLFLLSHVLLIDQAIGISWPTLPALISDILTLIAILGIVVLLILRLSTKAARALNRPTDIYMPILIALPFLSGFLVMHPTLNPFPFQATLLVHVLTGNLIIAIIPFSKLVHMISLPTNQVVSEIGWHFPPDAGEKVALALGKENQPI